MKHTERASLMRVVTDLIEADGIIDTREMGFLGEVRRRYDIRKEDEVAAAQLTLAKALGTLADMDPAQRRDLLGDFMRVALSDDFCAREEALLMLAVEQTLGGTGSGARVISTPPTPLLFESTQILYVESERDEQANAQIERHWRTLSTEIRLAGFDFVYLPKIAEHYRSMADGDLLQIVDFLYPKVGQLRLQAIIRQLKELSTAKFCREQLAAKLHLKDLAAAEPSLMIKIGDSRVDDRPVANFLLAPVEGEVLQSVRALLDTLAESYRNYRLNYLREERGRFVFKGFYKQVFDILALRRGVRSSVVIDPCRERIWFPEADAALDGVHRREKALYALFLLESASGGINFSKPASPKLLQRYNRRMEAIQKKYRAIYRMFGGEESRAPSLEVPETRLPMLSRIKRQILRLGDILYHADSYTVQRNFYGNYSVRIDPALCLCCRGKEDDIVPLAEAEEWQRIAAK